jgi:hypothetical protein
MNDVELVVRHLGFLRREVPYRGDLKAFLDQVCVELNDQFVADPSVRDNVLSQLDQMSAAIEAGLIIFDRGEFCRKFVDGEYQTRFNRAVFDVQVAALAAQPLRETALADPPKFKEAYERASQHDEFVRAVETTTKTALATSTRFDLFFNELDNEFGIALPRPNIQEA